METKKVTNEERLELRALFYEGNSYAAEARRFEQLRKEIEVALTNKTQMLRSKYEVADTYAVDIGSGEFKDMTADQQIAPAEVSEAVAAGAKRLAVRRK